MEAELTSKQCKRGGKKPYFGPTVYMEIARKYYRDDQTADALAEMYQAFSPSGKLSPSSIRNMARRGQDLIDQESAKAQQDGAT